MGQENRWTYSATGLSNSASMPEDSRLRRSNLDSMYRVELAKRSGQVTGSKWAGEGDETRRKKGQSFRNLKGKDKKAPKVSLDVLSPVTAGNSIYEFIVTYTDNKAIKARSIDSNDIRVIGSNGYNQLAKKVGAVSSGKGKTFRVTYQVGAPNGAWDAADNGFYRLALQANQVCDTSRNFIRAKGLGGLSVAISPAGNAVPTASLDGTGYFTNKSTTFDFFITYSDDKAIDIDSLGDGDILVVGPNGFSQLAKKISLDTPSSGTPRKVRYRFIAPGGTWDASDNGSYKIDLQAGQVKDSDGSFAAAKNLGSFPLTIPSTPAAVDTPVAVESIAPTASLSAANLSTGDSSTYDFTVTYTDNNAVNVASFDNNDVQVTGPNGFNQLATFLSVNDSSNGNPRTVTYRVTAPGGSWDNADNGSYSVTLQSNQVSDTNGNFASAASLGTFLANIPLPYRAVRASGGSNGQVGGFSLTIDADVKPQGNVFSKAIKNFRFDALRDSGITPVASNIDLGSADVTSSVSSSGVKFVATFPDYQGNLLPSANGQMLSDGSPFNLSDGSLFTLSSNRLEFVISTADPNAFNSLLTLENFLKNNDVSSYGAFFGNASANGKNLSFIPSSGLLLITRL